MTGREKLEAEEKRIRIFDRAMWRCRVCGEPLGPFAQLAHRIPKRKDRLRKYGHEVIHHELNLVAVECLECNAAVDLSNRPLEEAELVKKIVKYIAQGG